MKTIVCGIDRSPGARAALSVPVLIAAPQLVADPTATEPMTFGGSR